MRICRERSGFTLIELMVVIAIIVVLAAFLFPVFSATRQKAREATCLSNLHQLGIALKAYIADQRLYPPPPTYDPTANGNVGLYSGGFSALYPNYVTDKNLFLCPEDRFWGDVTPEQAKAKNYCSYNGVQDTGAANAADRWQFKTMNFNSADRPMRTYNYYGYTVVDPAVGNSDGYDLFVATDFPSPNNQDPNNPPGNYTLPAWLACDTLGWRFYPHLVNRYAPDNTIVAHCTHHRENYSDPKLQMDMFLRLGGQTEKRLVTVMTQPDASLTGACAAVPPALAAPPFVHQR